MFVFPSYCVALTRSAPNPRKTYDRTLSTLFVLSQRGLATRAYVLREIAVVCCFYTKTHPLMAPPRWTTPEQLNFLTTKIPIYRDAQKNDATSDFLDQVYTEWFDKFPEPDSQGDGSDEKVAHRKYVSQNIIWLMVCTHEILQQIYNWLRNYSRVPKSNANFGHEDHDIHTAALRQCLKKCAQKTGYVFFVAAGGPHPRADGRLETFRCVPPLREVGMCDIHDSSISVPPTEDGESVSNVIGEFNGAIMTPFTTAVHRIFGKYLQLHPFCKSPRPKRFSDPG